MTGLMPEQLRVIRGTSVVTPSIAPVDKGPQVAMTMFPGTYDCDAIAARIVRTWNCHEDLLTALQECVEAINPPDRNGISMDKWNHRLKAATKTAKIAIAKATP